MRYAGVAGTGAGLAPLMAAGRARRRYWRTVVLGILCLATLLWAAVDQFGVPAQTVAELALACVLGVLGVILAAGLCVLLWQGLRRLLRGRREPQD